MDWKTQETNKPKRIEHHGLTSVCEPRPGEHQSGKFRKNIDQCRNIAYYPTQRTLSHSCIHGLPAHPSKLHPHAALHQSCEKGRGDCFLVSVKKKSQDKLISGKAKKNSWNWKPIPAGARQTESLTSSVVVVFQWKSESPWKTQCGKKGYKKIKKTSLGTKQNNHQPKKIGKACAPSHATLLLKMLHHWHGFLTSFVSKQGFVDWFFHDFPCCPNSPTVLYVRRWKWSLYRSVTFLPNRWPPARSHTL